MDRRSFLKSALSAPALVMTPGLLMPVKPRVIEPKVTKCAVYRGMTRTVYDWKTDCHFYFWNGEFCSVKLGRTGERGGTG